MNREDQFTIGTLAAFNGWKFQASPTMSNVYVMGPEDMNARVLSSIACGACDVPRYLEGSDVARDAALLDGADAPLVPGVESDGRVGHGEVVGG